MMEAVRTSETSVDNNFTRQYIPEDNSEQKNSLTSYTRLWPVRIGVRRTQSYVYRTQLIE
jgi:hypothetical protein